jgi:hypothetical protein
MTLNQRPECSQIRQIVAKLLIYMDCTTHINTLKCIYYATHNPLVECSSHSRPTIYNRARYEKPATETIAGFFVICDCQGRRCHGKSAKPARPAKRPCALSRQGEAAPQLLELPL